MHRHMHRALGSVYAFKSEIENWRKGGERLRAPRPERTAGSIDTTVGVQNSIAVLPFANLSPDRGSEYFVDGLTDEIIADLSKIQSLRVISRTSSMTFKGTGKDIRTIGRKLGVRYVLEGSVRRAASRLRISARLIDASKDHQLWADKYEGSLEDVFAIQERLARTIAEALRLQLTTDEDQRLARRPIANLPAYECYLQARQEALRWRRDAIDHAVQLLSNGLAIVGENAELYAALGRAHLHYREAGIDFSERPLKEAESCARKVFALEPASASGLLLRGWIRYSRGQIQEAVRDLKATLEIDANNPDSLSLLSNCYLISGKVTASRPLIHRLMAVDPLTPLSRCMPGFADLMEGNLAAAVEPYRQMFEMDPGNPMGRLFYACVLALNGRTKEVTAIAESFPAPVQDTIPGRLTCFLARALEGDRPGALAMLTPQIEAAGSATELFPRFLAQGYALARMPEPAIHWLSIAVERGFINYPFLAQHDPSLENLRKHSRFKDLMKTVRERWMKFEA